MADKDVESQIIRIVMRHDGVKGAGGDRNSMTARLPTLHLDM
jgi:hypothetical protein